MPSPAELLGRIVAFVGEILGASSLRFEIGPTLVVLGIVLVLLQLVARPISRWVTADAAGLAGVGRAMALAAESGTDAVVSLGGAGILRSTDALGRLQTLAALPLLGREGSEEPGRRRRWKGRPPPPWDGRRAPRPPGSRAEPPPQAPAPPREARY